MLIFKRKSERRGGRTARLTASLALGAGVLAGVGGAFVVGSTAAYAGTSAVSYTCTDSVIHGTYAVGATVSDTWDSPAPADNDQVPTTYTQNPSVVLAVPGALLDLAGGAHQAALDVDAATVDMNGGGSGGWTVATQTGNATNVPQVLPVLASGNPDTNVTLNLGPLVWTSAAASGGAGPWDSTLAPGALTFSVLGGSVGVSCTATSYPLLDSYSFVSPPTPPTVSPQSATVSSGQCTTVDLTPNSGDIGDHIDWTTTNVTTPSHGTAVSNGDGTVTYCNNGDASATDSFDYSVKNTTGQTSTTTPTVSITISFNTCVEGAGNPGGGSGGTLSVGSPPGAGSNGTPCSLHQLILLPVEPGQIVLSQSSGLPLDVLGSSLCASGTTPGIVLNGNEQSACGRVDPLTITNATGLDSGWTLTGQTSDFNDPAQPGITCDTVLTYSNHCIPGGNLSWFPDSAVAHGIVPGDTALVANGAIVPPVSVAAATNVDPLLAPTTTQSNPVVEPAPAAGLHDAPAIMCTTASGHAGGTFVCGAGLDLAVPASIAEPTTESHIGLPSYYATLTLTLF